MQPTIGLLCVPEHVFPMMPCALSQQVEVAHFQLSVVWCWSGVSLVSDLLIQIDLSRFVTNTRRSVQPPGSAPPLPGKH